MAQPARIPIPLKQHLLRFRISILPGIAFVLCVAMTLWLWQRQATVGSIIGEVEAYTVVVPAGSNGLLQGPSADVFWRTNDPIKKGDVIARLDDSPALARLKTVRLQATKLQADLEAVRMNFELDQRSVEQEAAQQQLRLTLEVERRRVRVLEVQSQKKAIETQLAGAESTLKMLQELADSPRMVVGDPVRLEDRKAERDLLKEKLGESEKLYREVVSQYRVAVAKAKANNAVELPEVEALLAPVRAEIDVQDAIMEELQVEIANLEIKSPIDGVITQVHRTPGIRVVPGDDIVSIARTDSNYVVTYVREEQKIQLYEGMRVGLRLRTSAGGPQFDSQVETVGPSIQPVPTHQLADASTPERGVLIRIPLPAQLKQKNLRPGQLVQVVFDPPK